MALILNIETSTKSCSVAIGQKGQLIANKEIYIKNSHSSMLTTLIKDVLKKAQFEFHNLDTIAISKGPGSYTGLRIGVSTAKGLCYAIDKPLISINSLKAMAYGITTKYKSNNETSVFFCPMIDARRMEVYSAIYDINNNEIRKTKAEIITKNSFSNILNKHKILFFGNGADKCKSILLNKNALFIDNIYASAVNMITIAEDKFFKKNFEDIACFEPFYLKDFIAGKPKVKGLA